MESKTLNSESDRKISTWSPPPPPPTPPTPKGKIDKNNKAAIKWTDSKQSFLKNVATLLPKLNRIYFKHTYLLKEKKKKKKTLVRETLQITINTKYKYIRKVRVEVF